MQITFAILLEFSFGAYDVFPVGQMFNKNEKLRLGFNKNVSMSLVY